MVMNKFFIRHDWKLGFSTYFSRQNKWNLTQKLMNNFFKRKIDKSYRGPPPPCFVEIKSYYLGGGGVKTELENIERFIDSDLKSAGIGDHLPLFY